VNRQGLESRFAGKLSAVDQTPDACQSAAVKSTYTAPTQQDGDWWVGWIEEIPGVNAQERSKEDLMASLGEILNSTLLFEIVLRLARGVDGRRGFVFACGLGLFAGF
jgi:hypothetical protein